MTLKGEGYAHYGERDIVKKEYVITSVRERRCYTRTAHERVHDKHATPQLQAGGVVVDQQVGGLRRQRGEDVRGGQRNESFLELIGCQDGKGDGSNGLQDGRGKHRRHPRGQGSTGEGEDGDKSALGDGLNDGMGNEGRNIWVEGLGRIKREEVGEETGGVGRSHGSTRNGVGGGLASGPGGEDVQT